MLLDALPPKPANAVFRVRVKGKIQRLGFNDLREARWFAQQQAAPGQCVEIIDWITGRLIESCAGRRLL